MESSTSSPALNTAAPALPPAPRRSPLRWLAGFGFTGLLGLAVLLFWLLAAALGPWLLSHSSAGAAPRTSSRRSARRTGWAPTTWAATCWRW